MAYKETEPTTAGTPSDLGEYTFNCVFDDSPTLGQFARASMSKDGQTVYKTVSLPNNTQIQGYSIEANDTEATVYAVIKKPKGGSGEHESGLDTSPVTQPIPTGGTLVANCFIDNDPDRPSDQRRRRIHTFSAECVLAIVDSDHGITMIAASATPSIAEEDVVYEPSHISSHYSHQISSALVTFQGKTVYGLRIGDSYNEGSSVSGPVAYVSGDYTDENFGNICWTMVYGTSVDPEYETEEIIVGRFAIDLEDAGGVGPGSDWPDPGDYDPDWEPEEPTHTLYVTVTGALSGRHNDPIEDPSYSYIPADKDTVKDYGCGGDGGHGGGGGAGASTVVVHKFATNQANSKEVTAIARRHGYGSGGGKGGKGGDGCILVYY